MSRASGRGRSLDERVDDVLHGRVQPTARELLDLIHEVNPTPRALPGHVAERRYELKNRLQSLLIREYSDALVVEPGPEGSPDVGLRHRYLGVDACHARIDALDVDARSWVRLQLDLGPGEEPASPSGRGGAVDESPEGLVNQGRAAMAEYDFEASERLLRDAFEASDGAAFAAEALFELLVDTLAMDDTALALAPRLSEEAAEQPSLRAALALAAARAGRTDESADWMANAKGSRAADAAAALARRAVDHGDFTAAGDWIERLRAHDPAHVELVPLTDAIERDRAERMKPLLEAKRREREAKERERAQALAQAIEEARKAEADGDDDRALRRWELARQLDGEVEEDLARVRERVARREREARVLRVATALEAPPFDPASLTEYGQLASGEREAVRALLQPGSDASRLVAWMEEAGLDGTTAKVRAASEAALELDGARLALEGGRPEEALQLLHHHERILAHIQDARRLTAEAHALVKARAKEAQERAEAERLARETVEREARRIEEREAHAARARAHADAGDLLEAQREGRLALRFEEDEAQRAAWATRLEGWAEDVARQWGRCVWEGEAGLSEAALVARSVGLSHSVLLPGGRSWLALVAHDEHLFAVEVDVPSQVVVRRARWRLPHGIELAEVMTRAGCVWGLGHGGELFEVSWPAGQVRRWIDLSKAWKWRFDGRKSLGTPAGTALVWIAAESDGSRAVDPDALVVHWEDGKRSWSPRRPLPLADETKLALDCYWEAALLRGVDAQSRREQNWPSDRRLEAITVHPDREQYVAIVSRPVLTLSGAWTKADETEPAPVWLRHWSARHPVVECELPESRTTGVHDVATSLDEGLVFALAGTDFVGDVTLLALRPGTGGLEEVWRADVTHTHRLASDEDARRVVLHSVSGPFELTDLGAHPPQGLGPFDLPPLWHGMSAPHAFFPMPCGGLDKLENQTPPQPDRIATERLLRRIQERQFEGVEEDILATIAHMHQLKASLGNRPVEEAILDFIEKAWQHAPEHPGLALAQAHALAQKGRWSDAQTTLEGVDPTPLAAHRHNHSLHLLGLALLRAGDLQGALAAFVRGQPPEEGRSEPCRLAALAELVGVLLRPIDELRWQEQASHAAKLTALLRLVDRALDEGRLDEAQALLDENIVETADELQATARQAHVAIERASAPEERFRRASRIASFLQLWREWQTQSEMAGLRARLHMGPHEWDEARLTALAERAERYLAEDAGIAPPAAETAA